MVKNGYRSHRGYSAIARRVIMSGAAGSTNAIMSPLGYWGGMKKGGLAPSVPAMPVGARSLFSGRPPLVNHPQHLMHKTHKYRSWKALCHAAPGYYQDPVGNWFSLEFPNTGANAKAPCNMSSWTTLGCRYVLQPPTCDCEYKVTRKGFGVTPPAAGFLLVWPSHFKDSP